ncbi:ABC transporter substrate-binding protein [Fluviispira multicolorata]|uniref:Solute-binding protein family 5 domain-containing protein n=1 Tax=Fluviispira multicolorata TaxID=2654512 RepID=A0A833N4T0_9BACT|nr:ABC transporter substrate-binding protein [Fluviispira multicolorata]KAB8028609.1 hypothetical protein GCL57_12890 [Fluviispira multicolorata]
MTSRFTTKRIIISIISITAIAFAIYQTQKASNENDSANSKEKKNTLSIALDSKIQSGDPRLIGGDANSQYIENLRFLPLIGFDEHGNIQNILIDEITAVSNKSWIITLKKNIKFNNGSLITAADVVATYNAIMNPEKSFPPSPRKAAFNSVTLFKVNSPHEIQINLKDPDASFLNNLVIGILPKDAILNAAPNKINDKGYESGPFILKKTTATDWLLTRNENYNYSSKPKVENIDFKIISDSGTRYAALIRGDLDLVQNSIDPDKVSLIQKSMTDKFQILSAPKLSTTYLAFNFRDPIFSNLKVRQAVAYAIDRRSLLQFRLQGQGSLAKGMFPPDNYFFDNSLPEIQYDQQRAKNLLKESNIQDPITFAIKVSSSNKSTVEVAKAIAANLKEVGFQPTVEMLENSVFLDQVKKGVAQVWLSPWVGFKDPDHLRFVFASNMVAPLGGNRGAYSNQNLDELLQEGREEINPEKRKIIYDQAQQLLSADLPYVYLWHSLNIAIVGKNIEGYKLYADGRYWSLVNVTKN